MKACTIAVASLAALGLVGCKPAISSTGPGAQPHGRYAGVGIFEPNNGWTKLAVGHAPTSPAAQLADDDAVIVVLDSQTGEVRACGDLSGYCVGMNPWKANLLSSQITPVPLAEPTAPDAGSGGASAASSN